MRHLAVMTLKLVVVAVAVPAASLATLVATGGAFGGVPTALVTAAVGGALWWWFTSSPSVRWPGRLVLAAPAVLVTLLAVWICVPVASTERRYQPPSEVAERRYWDLPTGSRLAYWHIEAPAGVPRHETPVVLVHGGPGGYAGEVNRRFLARLAAQGHDVWVYDQAGGGDSDRLPIADYSHERNVADLVAVLDRVGAPQVHLVSQSYGAQMVASLLADAGQRGRVASAVFVEPGPYDRTVRARFAVEEVYGGAPNGGAQATAALWWRSIYAKPRVWAALALPVGNGIMGQEEAINAYAGADLQIHMATSSCAADYETAMARAEGRFPVGLNLLANMAIDASGAERSLQADLAGSTVPIMVMLGECSYVGRQYQTALITDYPVVERVQYLTGVGHALWNGIGDHDDIALRSLSEFLTGAPPTIPSYPTKADVPEFLRQRR